MKVTFLGTAAAEGYPALWCRCQRCDLARRRGGRNLRFRSALLVNDDLLIDAGPDVLAASIRLGVDLAPVQALLVTHPHTDHLDPTTFFWRRKGFCATPLPLLHVYASQASIAKLAYAEGRTIDFELLRLQVHAIGAGQYFDVCTGNPAEPDPRFPDGAELPALAPARRYRVWTLAARHAEPAVEPMFFAVQQQAGPEADGRDALPALLYATDTGPFPDETWQALADLGAQGVRFGAAIIDSTSGAGKDSSAHMNLRQMEAHQEELHRLGLLAPGARRLAHHFSHNGTPPYEELVELLAPRGLEPSYDGMVVTL